MYKKCFVFDIDGTLANGDHRIHFLQRTPKDWDAYFALLALDSVNEPVAEVCRAIYESGHEIIYVSGRPAKYEKVTYDWLEANDLPYIAIPIYMRPDGDYRDDDIVKLELLKKAEADRWVPVMIFDDRNRVVIAARGAGYTVAQVAPGDF